MTFFNLRYIFAVATAAIFLFSACKDPGKKNEAPPEAKKEEASPMAGQWITRSIHVEVKTFQGTDKDTTMIINSGEFVEKMGIKLNTGVYNPDGTFREQFIGPNDSLLFEASGTWYMEGDTVFVEQKIPLVRNMAYHLELDSNNVGTFKGYVDWDSDEEKDDYYVGVSEKL